MRGWKRWAIWALIPISLAVIVLGLFHLHDRRIGVEQRAHSEIEDMVFRVVSAVKYDDHESLRQLLHSRSPDRKMRPEHLSRVLANVRTRYDLLSAPDADIRSSVHVDTVVSKDLMWGLLLYLTGTLPDEDWIDWSNDKPTAVRYSIRDIELVGLALHEDGEWKVLTIPFDLSANVLNHSGLEEALESNDWAVEFRVEAD